MSTSRILLLALAGLLLGALPIAAAPTGRAFTYQGRLSQAGVPVNGPVTLRFSLWNMLGTGDPPVGGVVIGGVQVVPNVTVTEGLFTVQLNAAAEFGPVAFNGEERWLQVEVCDDSTCGSATVLVPRQPLTATPYAAHALGPWTLSGTNLGYAGGNVGVGTTTPVAPLHIESNGPYLILQDTAPTASQAGYLGFWNSTPTETGWMGFGSPGSPHMSMVNARSGGNVKFHTGGVERLTVASAGNVGIGTSSPAGKLDVRGDIRLGSSGQYRAAGGAESLRILRGTIRSNGTILTGTGFTASRVLQGVYLVTYSSTFSVAPTVVVSARIPSGGAPRLVHTFNVTTSSFNVYAYLTNASSTDTEFDFVVMGAQ